MSENLKALNAFVGTAPWVGEKVSYRQQTLAEPFELPERAGVLLVHACGSLTDEGLAMAAKNGGPFAAMPCCYTKAWVPRVPSLSRQFGRETSIDISRSYRLAAEGYEVDWNEIPRAITPMNRLLVGWNR